MLLFLYRVDTTKPSTHPATPTSAQSTGTVSTKKKRLFSDSPATSIITIVTSNDNSTKDPMIIDDSPTETSTLNKENDKAKSILQPTVSTDNKANKLILDQEKKKDLTTATAKQNFREYLHQLPVGERDDVVMDINPPVRPNETFAKKHSQKKIVINLKKEPNYSLKKATISQEQSTVTAQVNKKETGSQLVPDHSMLNSNVSSDTPVNVNNSATQPNSEIKSVADNCSSSTTTTSSSLPSPVTPQNEIDSVLRPKKKRARLPAPWRVKMSDEGDIYYSNSETGEETSIRPV